ncbi:MAG: hypothetical protein DRN81_01175 [Thermoproteota archaeon]|nr:MAG: hypothetical protein DRN81_01175 [Candidatus Korarchaeota archaeon]
MESTAHVIMLNDYPEAVFIGSEEDAQKKANEMKKEKLEKDYYWMKGEELETQKKILYYHVRTVDVYYSK